MAMKNIDTNEKLVICHWCGYANTTPVDQDRQWFKIDGIVGHGECWNAVKSVLQHCGLVTNKTMIRDLVKIMKKARKRLLSGDSNVILFYNGDMIHHVTNEDTKAVKKRAFLYMGDLRGVAERFEREPEEDDDDV